MPPGSHKYARPEARPFDYIYDSTYLVSGARDYARTCFKAAMDSAQLVLQPVYRSMFSELRSIPRMKAVYHPNCRLPSHLDRSYPTYVRKQADANKLPAPTPVGRDLYMFIAIPKRVLSVPMTTPDFQPPAPTPRRFPACQTKPRNRGTQSQYRESSAQTIPWQPDGKAADTCAETPEVLYLDKLEWGPGNPYRLGDLPADFHTTEIINKLRHARAWMEVAERGQFPRWMTRRDQILCDVETKDWIFREAEIDELQDIRLNLLHKMQAANRNKATNRTSIKLARRWETNKQQMEAKIDSIRRGRDREIRKLTAIHTSGGHAGLVQRMRASRGMGSSTIAACDPTSDVHAAVARHGYQARGRHADITYDPTLLQVLNLTFHTPESEDHKAISKIPDWLLECGMNLKKTCSGHQLPRDPRQLCERETKWSEGFLENLHADLRKARMGAGAHVGPLTVMKARKLCTTPRPATPVVEAVDDTEELNYQSALLLQKIIRGRAVQCLMYEGRTRAAELTEELKTTHGLQKEDKARIANEEARCREYNAQRTEAEQKEDAIQGLVDELCGGAVSAALDFLEKELRRLKEERRQHAYILIALREKQMREAAEAGRRQKEEHRRREHDEMFKQILGVTQATVEGYLESIIEQGAMLGSEGEAVRRVEQKADKTDEIASQYDSMSTAEQNELVAELVHQFLLPEAHRTAAKHRIAAMQASKLQIARKAIFGLIDEAEKKIPICTQCGEPVGELCRCGVCPVVQLPTATKSRDDPRWRITTARPKPPVKTLEERYPPHHEMRCMLNALVDEVVEKARGARLDREDLWHEINESLKTSVEITLDAMHYATQAVLVATGEKKLPVRTVDRHHFSRMIRQDALERTEKPEAPCSCPKQLPSELRRIAEEEALRQLSRCTCIEQSKPTINFGDEDPEQRKTILPSKLRLYEEAKRCKCDIHHQQDYKSVDEAATDEMDTFDLSWSSHTPDS